MGDTPILIAYAAAWESTQQMLEAARVEAWERLLQLSQLRDQQLLSISTDVLSGTIDPAQGEAVSRLIRNILAADQQIQRLTQDWMEEIQGVLSSVKVEQKLVKAYQAV